MSTLAADLAMWLGGDPAIVSLIPADGSLLNTDVKTARWTPIVATLYTEADSVLLVLMTHGSMKWVIYDGQSFIEWFGAHSAVTIDGAAITIKILPMGGWWRSTLELRYMSAQEVTPMSLTPADGSTLNLDPEIARLTPVSGIVNVSPGHVLVIFAQIGSWRWTVYDGSSVTELFRVRTTISVVGTDQYQFAICPNAGWWRSGIEIRFFSAMEVIVPPQDDAILWLGDSNTLDEGVTTDNAIAWNKVIVGGVPRQITDVDFDCFYANASAEPLSPVDMGFGSLRAKNVSSFPGYGQELSTGEPYVAMLRANNKISGTDKTLYMETGISGVKLSQLVDPTYGTTTPFFNGKSVYAYMRDRFVARLESSKKKLGAVVITAGGNDGSNSIDANNVTTNMILLASMLRADFGATISLLFVLLNVNVDPIGIPFSSVVRSQMVAGVAAIANSRLAVIDRYPLTTDLLHYKADPVWDMGLEFIESIRQMRALNSLTTTVSDIRGWGTPSYNAATLSPFGYNLSVDGDIELLFVAAMKNFDVSPSISTPVGWTALDAFSRAIGGQTQRASLFIRPLTQADLDANDGMPPPVSISPGGDENYAVRLTLFGVSGVSGIPGHFSATSFSSSGMSDGGGPLTASTNNLVLTLVCGQGGGLSPSIHYTASNATTNPQLVIEAPMNMNTSNFGLMAVFKGRMESIGVVPATTITPNIVTNVSGFTVAFQ